MKSKSDFNFSSSSCNNESVLPFHLNQELQYFDKIDTIYCFLMKQRVACNIQLITSLFRSLFLAGNDVSIPAEDHFKKLKILKSLCPKLITLKYPEDNISGKSVDTAYIELIFKDAPKVSASNVKKRRTMMLEALLNVLFQFYKNNAPKPHIEIDFQRLLTSGELNFSFENCQLNLMENTNIDEASTNAIEERIYSISSESFLARLKCCDIYRGQISHVERVHGREAKFDTLKLPLPQILLLRLESCLNIKDGEFYTHQANAITAIRSGSHVAISTSTASGKSLIYNISVLDAILADKEVTALYLFPTKALAQDQLRSIQEFTGCGSIIPAAACVCDGDTSQSERFAVQERGNIILTNPDMLHVTLLPEHKKWVRIWKNLRFVVIDEAHYYKGAFGAHVAMVFRRLVRVCLHYGLTCPQFICCSATILNPEEHMQKLVPLDMITAATTLSGETKKRGLVVIGSDMDGSPQGERTFIIWNPPLRRQTAGKDPSQYQSSALSIIDEVTINKTLINSSPSQVHFSNTSNRESYGPAVAELFSPHQQTVAVSNFVEGCCDRPSTIGESTADKFHGVTYQGGWKRKRNPKTSANKKSTSKGADFNAKDDESSKHSHRMNEMESTKDLSFRVSSIYETSQLFVWLVKENIRTLAFCRVRKLVELVLKYALSNLDQSAPHLKDQIASYRGGYTMKERRQIESSLFSGQLVGVTATCALELGIDLGCLDATLHLGFPGTFSSLWQQAGRAGRGGRDALSIMICFECPVDQFFARHPEVLFHSPMEKALLDIDNVHILRQHLLCAAKELPLHFVFSKTESTTFVADTELLWGNKYAETLDYLVEARSIVSVSGNDLRSNAIVDNLAALWKYNPCVSPLKDNPARSVSLRQIDPVTISIVDDTIEDVNDKQIDSLGYSRAFFELYEGAIFMHRGEQYLVHKLDLQSCTAHTRPVNVKYLTSARNKTSINVIKPIEKNGVTNLGVVQVVCTIYGYNKYWLGSNEIMETCECSLPPLEYETLAFWIDLPLEIKKSLEEDGLSPLEAIHGANHVLESMCPLFAQCDAGDIGTEHGFSDHSQDHLFRIMIFDKRSGGLGAANAMYESRQAVIQQAVQLVSSCPCDSKYPKGCPSCLLDLRCSNYNNNISKSGALRLFQLLLVYMQGERSGLMSNESTYTTPLCGSVVSSLPTSPSRGSSDNNFAPIIDETPRKKSREKALRSARLRNSVRARQMAVQMNWSESIPTFSSEG